MTAILRHLPFFEQESEAAVGLERVRIKPYQIIVWVSVTARNVLELPPHAPRLPAILDTGHSHNFSIQHRHLTDWVQVQPDLLRQIGAITVEGQHVPLHDANVWLRRNLPRHRDLFSDELPYRLKLDRGLAVYPRGSDFPPLPLLGLRAIVRNKLHFWMDPERCVVHLRTQDWRTKLLRWLS